jgi:hypothetical protein
MIKPPIVIWFGVIRVLQRSEMITVSMVRECKRASRVFHLRGIENDPLSQRRLCSGGAWENSRPHAADAWK